MVDKNSTFLREYIYANIYFSYNFIYNIIFGKF